MQIAPLENVVVARLNDRCYFFYCQKLDEIRANKIGMLN